MNRITAFISYSAKQKVIGGNFRKCLNSYCGYETFIAHDDIPGSALWEEEIIRAIEKADFFIPLLSDDFKRSDFTDQETGIPITLKKKIIPIKLEQVNPYGFISKYQALQYKKYKNRDNVKELALMIAEIGLANPLNSQLHQKAMNSITYAFCNSKTFGTINAIIETMSTCDHFTTVHIEQIIRAVKNNEKIRIAINMEKLKKVLSDKYNVMLD